LGLLCNHSHQRGIHNVRMLRGNRDGFLKFFLYIVSFRFRFKAETMSVVCHGDHQPRWLGLTLWEYFPKGSGSVWVIVLCVVP